MGGGIAWRRGGKHYPLWPRMLLAVRTEPYALPRMVLHQICMPPFSFTSVKTLDVGAVGPFTCGWDGGRHWGAPTLPDTLFDPLVEEPSQQLEKPAGRAGPQCAAQPLHSPAEASVAPPALSGPGPCQCHHSTYRLLQPPGLCHGDGGECLAGVRRGMAAVPSMGQLSHSSLPCRVFSSQHQCWSS